MEIRPVKEHKLPRYAACLAAVASVSMLTGCGFQNKGEVATTGVAPEPVTEELELAGSEAVIEDDTVNVTECSENAPNCQIGTTETLPDQSEFQLAGEVDAPSDAEVDGFVAVSPEFDDANYIAADVSELLADSIRKGFAEHGITVEPDDTWFDMQSKYKSTDGSNLRVCFFDGSVVDEIDGMTGWEHVEEMMDSTGKTYDWGFTKEIYKATDGVTYRIVYIDLARCGDADESAFAAIAEDLTK
ncbi:MAG: hypothetical protein IKN55_08770 [Oscillospiraceae bacterium]|nr:hypothetical protein [Oscillospiraceae bacterium]